MSIVECHFINDGKVTITTLFILFSFYSSIKIKIILLNPKNKLEKLKYENRKREYNFLESRNTVMILMNKRDNINTYY